MERKTTQVFIRVCLILALVVFPGTAFGYEIISPTADSFTLKSDANKNFGTGHTIRVKANNEATARYGWLQFTLESEPVPYAELWIYQTSGGSGEMKDFRIRGSAVSFSETGITWNNQPGGTTLNWGTGILGPVNWAYSGTGWRTIDMTNFYNANLGNTVSLRLRGEDQTNPHGNTMDFATKENPDPAIRPYLIIPEPGSFAVLAFGMASAGGMLIRRRRR